MWWKLFWLVLEPSSSILKEIKHVFVDNLFDWGYDTNTGWCKPTLFHVSYLYAITTTACVVAVCKKCRSLKFLCRYEMTFSFIVLNFLETLTFILRSVRILLLHTYFHHNAWINNIWAIRSLMGKNLKNVLIRRFGNQFFISWISFLHYLYTNSKYL